MQDMIGRVVCPSGPEWSQNGRGNGKRDEIQTNRHLIAPRISKLNIYAAHAALATLLPRASLAK
jgi:hypothetical protein